MDAGLGTNDALNLGLISVAIGEVLAAQGDFDGAQTRALRISSSFAFRLPLILNGRAGSILMSVAPDATRGSFTTGIGSGSSPLADSLVPSGQVTNFSYFLGVPEPSPAILLGLGLAAFRGAQARLQPRCIVVPRP